MLREMNEKKSPIRLLSQLSTEGVCFRARQEPQRSHQPQREQCLFGN